MKTVKWYWWIPIFGFFFVEEATEWLYGRGNTPQKDRLTLYSGLWFYHSLLIISVLVVFILGTNT